MTLSSLRRCTKCKQVQVFVFNSHWNNCATHFWTDAWPDPTAEEFYVVLKQTLLMRFLKAMITHQEVRMNGNGEEPNVTGHIYSIRPEDGSGTKWLVRMGGHNLTYEMYFDSDNPKYDGKFEFLLPA